MSLAAAIALLAAAAGAPEADALAEAGRLLYEEGTRASGGAVLARVGTDPAPADGRLFPCAGCHGKDGRGRPEGAVLPPPLRWRELTKPYGHEHGARRHPAFDERSLARAVVEGVDPAGNTLDLAMPRYSLSRSDLTALVAWLRRLEARQDPGLAPRALRLGAVLPITGPAAGAGLAMRTVLEASLEEVNAAGGVNGRRLALEVADAAQGPEAAVASLGGEGGVFALVSGLAPGGEAALAEAAERAGLPLVGPFAPRGEARAGLVFHLTAGAADQARVLVDWAAQGAAARGGGGALVVLRPAGAEGALLAAAAREQATRRGLPAPAEVVLEEDGPEAPLAAALRRAGTATVLHLGGDGALAALLAAAAEAGFAPTVLVPGGLASRAALAAPKGFGGRIYLAFPASPADETAAGRARLARLAGEGGLTRHRAAQASAAAAAAVLVEALRRAGRDLDREALVARLEGLQSFETGLLPPLSFGPGRRTGAAGAWVVRADPAGGLQPVDGWRRLE